MTRWIRSQYVKIPFIDSVLAQEHEKPLVPSLHCVEVLNRRRPHGGHFDGIQEIMVGAG